MIATLMLILLQAAAPGPKKNEKRYMFGHDMHHAIYGVSADESAWRWLPHSIIVGSYGAAEGVALHYDSIIVTKKAGAKWAPIDAVMTRLLHERSQPASGIDLPTAKPLITWTMGPGDQMLDENGTVSGSWRIVNVDQQLRETEAALAESNRRLAEMSEALKQCGEKAAVQ